MIRLTIAIASVVLLIGCAGPRFDAGRTETVLPLHRAWVDGRQVEYITTDISDGAMAEAAGVNHVPRLRDAIAARPSVLERTNSRRANRSASFNLRHVPWARRTRTEATAHCGASSW